MGKFDKKVYFVALLSIAIWASVYSVLHIALHYISAEDLAFLRLSIATIFLFPYAVVTRTPIPAKKYWKQLFIIGAVGFAAYGVLLNLGQSKVEAGTASLIIATTPIIATGIAAVFLREKLNLWGYVGLLMSLTGIAFILVGHGKKMSIQYSPSLLILLGAAVVHAIHFVIQKASLRELSPLQVTLYSMLVGAVLLTPFAPGAIEKLLIMPTGILIAVLFLGIFPSALAHLMWAFVVKDLPISTTTILLNLISPMAVLIGMVWLHEIPTPLILFGGSLVITAIFLVQVKERFIFSIQKLVRIK